MKVLFQSRKTLYSVPGGDTTQIMKTKEFLEKLGVIVDVSLELTPDVSEYDVVHVFNLMRPQELYLQVKNAKKYRKKVALSTIYGPYEEYEKVARGGILQIMNNLLSISQIEYLKVIARAVLNFEFNKGTVIYLLNGHKRLQRKILKMVDVFLPNSDSEMMRVVKDFNMRQYNYISVSNAVDVSKFNYDEIEVSPELEKYCDCVLCVARIEGRKNQLNIIRACKDLPYKLVFIGKAGANSKKYYEKCQEEASANTFFLGQIEHEKLPQFYKLAKVHILASWMETPGLSSLEAGIMHTNVVVTKKGDTEDYFKQYAFYCEPDDLSSIRKAVKQAFNTPFDERFLERIRDNYKWEDTAQQTYQGYKSIME
ncbi:glycosyltransferase [Parabacteroides faecis]|uniref:glycosyltransferase family 4 protein n=1 Tax=Parabacteroides faecis TaxID=1217282 RepID=UPI002164BC7F|nr:glycosyltransferase [Parabacteroides faecis]MCS2892493.1 glycosyltransferase [Parabacteroides faecis]UVQ48871.1 glycosyltransferase [Parabacteroides faecis]